MQHELTAPGDSQANDIRVEHCANCGADMLGTYCSRCGQPTRHFIKFFPSVVREIVEDTLDIDGRFGRTIWTIMFRPGRATKDFLSGKRVHYTPPFRLYLFTSLLAFLLFSIEAGEIRRGFEDGANATNTSTQQVETDAEQLPLTNPDATEPDNPEANTIIDNPESTSSDSGNLNIDIDDDEDADGFTIRINGNEDWDPVANPVNVGWLPDGVNALINGAIGNIKQNGPRIRKNPGLLVDKVIQLLPQTLFILLPIFALILKFFYMFSKRYYMEHLIYSVHIHTFTLMILIVVTALNMADTKISGVLRIASESIQALLMLWILVYMFIAQKRVYNQGWFFTFIKYNLVYFTYTILQIFAIAIVIVIGAATL